MSLEKGDPFWDAYEEEDRSVERGTEAGIKHFSISYNSYLDSFADMVKNSDGSKVGNLALSKVIN